MCLDFCKVTKNKFGGMQMQKERIEQLVSEWSGEGYMLISRKDLSVSKTEKLLRDTYELCALYADKEEIPKEMLELFLVTFIFVEKIKVIDEIDDLSSECDAARFIVVDSIIDTIKYGLKTGDFGGVFPELEFNDIMSNKNLIINLEEPFLEKLIDLFR